MPLDDATAAAGARTPERTARNALRAARDPSAIGYIGVLNSGASAVSMPFMSEAGIAQIRPSNTCIGLTRGGPGTDRGDVERVMGGRCEQLTGARPGLVRAAAAGPCGRR